MNTTPSQRAYARSKKQRALIMEALDGAERIALPLLGSVEDQARTALRVARDAVDPDVHPNSTQQEVSEALGAMTRACGGIVIVDSQPHFAHDWILRAQRSHDPYLEGLAGRVQEAIFSANEKRK